MNKKVSSTVLLALVYEAYQHDPEGFVDDLRIIVANAESLLDFATQAIEMIEMEDDDGEIEYEEELKKVPALLANR